MTVNAKHLHPPFPAEHLEAISKVLADTMNGLTGSEIGHLLQPCNIPDLDPSLTKWKRLYNTFADFQNEQKASNHVLKFIQRAMDPARYVGEPGCSGLAGIA